MSKILVAFGDSWPWGAELDSLASPHLFDELDTESKSKLSAVIDSIVLKTSADHDILAETIRRSFAYPYLVAEHLGCESVIDMSGQGTSLNHMFLELCKFKDMFDAAPNHEYIFLVSLTALARDLYFDCNSGKPREIMPSKETDWYYKKFYHERTEAVNWVKNVSLFQLFCKQHSIADFYFQEFIDLRNHQELIKEYQAMIDWSRVYDRGDSCFLAHFMNLEGEVYDQDEPRTAFYPLPIKKYFYPCVNHPNILGHECISKHVVDFIRSLNPELIST